MARHPLIAGDHVAHSIIADMTDMDAARRIGKHFQHIGAGFGRHVVGDKGRLFIPNFLPPRVGDVRVKALGIAHKGLSGDRRPA